MTVMITGAFGFLGTNLCDEYLRAGRKVVAYDLTYRIPRFLKEFENDENLITVRGDVTDPWRLIESIKRYDVTDMIHAATLLEDKASLQRPYNFLRTNIMGGLNVLEAARHCGIRRLVVVSSRAAYGSYEPSQGPLKEESFLKPSGFYGASKAAIDLVLPLYRRHYKVDAVSIRTTGIFGPGQGESGMSDVGTATLIYSMLNNVLSGKPFSLSSGGDHYLEFCYVKDLTKWIKVVMEREHLQHPLYNLCYGQSFSIKEIVDIIKELLPDADISIGPGRLGGNEVRAALDICRARDEFGYRPSPLKGSLEKFIEYLKSGTKTKTCGVEG